MRVPIVLTKSELMLKIAVSYGAIQRAVRHRIFNIGNMLDSGSVQKARALADKTTKQLDSVLDMSVKRIYAPGTSQAEQIARANKYQRAGLNRAYPWGLISSDKINKSYSDMVNKVHAEMKIPVPDKWKNYDLFGTLGEYRTRLTKLRGE